MTWVRARRDGICSECESDIRVGENIFHEDFKTYCESCGEEIAPVVTESRYRILREN